MNAVQPPAVALQPLQTLGVSFLSRFQGLRDRMPGDGAVRAEAAQVFDRTGLPTQRVEAWKYTSLRPLADIRFREPLTQTDGSASRQLGDVPDLGAPRLVFLDGRFRPDLSDPGLLGGSRDGIQVEHFGHSASFGDYTGSDGVPLVALNTMLSEDGMVLTISSGIAAGTIVLVNLASDMSGEAVDFHPRHTIRLGSGASLTLVEICRGRGTYLHNAVTQISVAEDAVLEHIRWQNEDQHAFHIATVFADVAARGRYEAFVLNMGGRVARAEFHARLEGEGGAVHVHGAQLLRDQQVGDITSIVRHTAPGCSSRQAVRNVLAGRSRGVFQGKIEVTREAQKTDGYQMNAALLLSDEAEIDTKPELEIFADDVKCSHGATVGELDADQMFYLRSRGVPEVQARAILVRAFLAEAIDTVSHEGARAILDGAINAWWTHEEASETA
ncbi:Fe-S cluster assembly protein SufD [Granulibacter bethesdensis]|uniref:Fe-S cluster assembly protein SufD n=1 Tax=Granulibacter bethesdensis TaxID=364410 RepID=UPI00090A19AC|nr:Fe-S cluster assembly protein SufD [Granulibacter bethesdensis]APH52048.1 SufD protein [Granulibacter bethesdensis]